jgi:lipopolysaccharide transport system permease protein
MSAELTGYRIEWQGFTAQIEVKLRGEAPAPGALALGYQIYDPESGVLVFEGPHTPLAASSGDAPQVVSLPVTIPRQPGDYRVFVSLLEAPGGWSYARGGRFLLLDVRATRDRLTVRRERIMVYGRLRLELLVRSAARALIYPFRTIRRNRSLIRSMVRRDIQARYRGSLGGVLWTVLNPVLLMATYVFVFGVVLRARFEADPTRFGFVLYFLAGMLPWLAFSEAAARGPSVVWEHANLVKKLVFPIEILPVNLTLAGLVTGAFAILVFIIVVLAARGSLPLTVLALPLVLIPQLLFTAGFGWILAATGVYLRDLGQFNGYLLTLWFFLTPICYPEQSLPPEALGVLTKNPMYVFVSAYRGLFLEGEIPTFGTLARLWTLSFALFIGGHAWFYRLKRGFPDLL